MKRRVDWSHDAVEQLVELMGREPKLARRVLIAVREYRNGSRVDLRKLQGRDDTWRIRAGDWRILVTVVGGEAAVESIDNRRDAY